MRIWLRPGRSRSSGRPSSSCAVSHHITSGHVHRELGINKDLFFASLSWLIGANITTSKEPCKPIRQICTIKETQDSREEFKPDCAAETERERKQEKSHPIKSKKYSDQQKHGNHFGLVHRTKTCLTSCVFLSPDFTL